ncbi:ABC transporter ATP-binding protein [Erysipelothrix rhusiopathiae]|uniref:ABC transporter ATP-binding protein n=1 Tax=Erysipelothrix rhusiopathiae TaxID=1648 RepID=UPI000F432C0F|nr:ABC transporter ATP-binding protein [Erysipelothrix rhusiopathiae]AYV34054.1 ABC transporter ATP-binding protein [Erysipelothrix rhusiopathiae]MDE8082645.1 ABC transporter ATP-binding protein [Erysipelothrix rhusiopathiae]MDE8313833.1 ABC transporter ATP-binding protein [Erysipelothrix rhusiopathiae]MDE8328882.1 ABC transporter ATP-binding protein [Erysipelothrix rhusiopathiae]
MIYLDAVTKSFTDGKQTVEVLHPVSLHIERGSFVAIVGPSGSGKSTLLTIMGALQKPSSGNVTIENQQLSNLNEKQQSTLRFNTLGFILQTSNLIPFFTVYEHFEFKIKQSKNHIASTAIDDLLKSLDIYDIQNQYPESLSGGERQRVAIGLALILNPTIILADEPTASLDTERAFDVINLLKKVAKEYDTSVIMVTHDLRMIEDCDETYQMIDGTLTHL